jgi:hypothetical protein
MCHRFSYYWLYYHYWFINYELKYRFAKKSGQQRFYYYNGNSGWLSLKHFLNFCLFRTFRCIMFKAKTNNTRIFQWYFSWFNKLCSNFNYYFSNFSGYNKYYKFFSFLVMTGFFGMISFTTI